MTGMSASHAAKASAVSLRPESDLVVLSRPSSPGLEPRGGNKYHLSLKVPSSDNAFSVEIDRPSTPSVRQRDYLSHPITSTELDFGARSQPVSPGGTPSFFSQSRGGPIPEPTLRSRLRLLVLQTWTNTLSAGFLLFIVVWALSARGLAALPSMLAPWRRRKDFKRAWDQPDKYRERLVKDPSHYAEACGYRIVHQTVETEDGYQLRVHKVIVPGRENAIKADGKGGWPVILQHGLFQTSGSFVTSEERSLAFWLAEHGCGLCSQLSWC
jgi:lysosomal acid lipase/cholesteryl ester hydrolase